MSKKILFTIHVIIVIVQTILHYLGLLGLLLGVIAIIFKNTNRGIELLIGGASFIVIKYLIGFIYMLLVGRKINDIEKNHKQGDIRKL